MTPVTSKASAMLAALLMLAGTCAHSWGQEFGNDGPDSLTSIPVSPLIEVNGTITFPSPGYNSSFAIPVQKTGATLRSVLLSIQPQGFKGELPLSPGLKIKDTQVWRFDGSDYSRMGHQSVFQGGSNTKELNYSAQGSKTVNVTLPKGLSSDAAVTFSHSNPGLKKYDHTGKIGAFQFYDMKFDNDPFSRPEELLTGFSSPQFTIQAGDIDKDGYVDLVGGFANGSVATFYNDGSGGFAARYCTVGGSGVRELSLIDLDNDGSLDGIGALDSGALVLLMNKNGLLFPTVLQGEASPMRSAGAGDLDNDG
jgi:hypothetical protein